MLSLRFMFFQSSNGSQGWLDNSHESPQISLRQVGLIEAPAVIFSAILSPQKVS